MFLGRFNFLLRLLLVGLFLLSFFAFGGLNFVVVRTVTNVLLGGGNAVLGQIVSLTNGGGASFSLFLTSLLKVLLGLFVVVPGVTYASEDGVRNVSVEEVGVTSCPKLLAVFVGIRTDLAVDVKYGCNQFDVTKIYRR